jgi:hypothetical protein
MVVPHRIYSHGGMGVGEIFRKRDVIAGSLYQMPNDNNSAETCPLYNMLKLSRNLFFHDPDPQYMNYYEQGLYNQILGSRRDIDSTDNPQVTYFVPARPGQRRTYGNVGTCCGGTGMENHTKYQDSIYFRAADDSALYVNLYIDSTLRWEEKGLTLVQTTKYPFDGVSKLTIDSAGIGTFQIKLRVPVWVGKSFEVRVNGSRQSINAVPGTYVALRRQWRRGDAIDIAMPLRFRVERSIDNPAIQSIFYGPTLLAVQATAVGNNLESGLIPFSFFKSLKLDGDLSRALAPGGKALHFTSNGQTLAPFHLADPEPGMTRPYHLYFRRHEPSVVFGSFDSGVANSARSDGLTFLDVLWEGAPFANHVQFVRAVEKISEDWRRRGLFTDAERAAILQSAEKAREELRV